MIVEALRERLSPEQRRFIKFCIVGGSGVFVNLAFLAVGQWLTADLSPTLSGALASGLGIVVSVFTNFLINSAWTWGDRDVATGASSWAARLGTYYLASAAAIGIQFGTAQGLYLVLEWNLYLAQCCGILLGTVVNYLANNRWTFASKDGASN